MAPAPVDGQADLPVAASPSTDAPSSVAAPFPQADFEDLDLETLEALEAAAIEAAAAKAAAAKAVPAKAVPAYIANDSRAQELAQEAQELLAKADIDGDSRLSFEEFLGEESQIEKLFKKMDKDNNGKVSK